MSHFTFDVGDSWAADSESTPIFSASLCISDNCSTPSRFSSLKAKLAVGLDCVIDVSATFGELGWPLSYAEECNMSFALCNLRKTAASFELSNTNTNDIKVNEKSETDIGNELMITKQIPTTFTQSEIELVIQEIGVGQ